MSLHVQTLRTRATRATWIAAGVATALAVLITLHQRPFNGPWFFPWHWSRLSAAQTAGVGGLVAAHLGVVALAFRRPNFWWRVAAIAVASFGLRVGVSTLESTPAGLTFAAQAVRDPEIGSYFVVAQAWRASGWTLADYPRILTAPGIPLHAVNKPPGPVLYWSAFLRLCGDDAPRAAVIGGVVSGAIAAAAIPLVALLALRLRRDRRSASHAAAMLSLAPGALVFFPLFDPALTTWALLGMIAWLAAMDGRPWRATIFGCWLAATMFVAFHVLAIGLFLAAISVRRVASSNAGRPLCVGDLAARTVVALLAAAVGLLVMRVVTGYDAIESLRVAVEQQRLLIERYGHDLRPFPATIRWDLYDAALGIGFAPAVLAIAGAIGTVGDARGTRWLAIIGLSIWATVAGFALMPGETARVWNFLTPVVLVPAAAVLASAAPRARRVFYAALGVALIALVQALTFMSVAPILVR